MQKGERIIISVNPNFNSTGRKHPNVIKQEMLNDPDFEKLPKEAQLKVLRKVDGIIKSVEDIKLFGTLKEKYDAVEKIMNESNICTNVAAQIRVSISEEEKIKADKAACMADGKLVKAGDLLANYYIVKEESTSITKLFGVNAGGRIHYKCIDQLFTPVAGKVFLLRKITYGLEAVDWHDDLFIIGSEDDTRAEALEWYFKTTGKKPVYKTPEEKKAEKLAEETKVNDFLSKWDI